MAIAGVGHAVAGLLITDVTIAIDGHLLPDGDVGLSDRQGFELSLFQIMEALDRLFEGGAMGTLAGGFQHPCFQLLIGLLDTGQRTQRHKIVFNVFDPGFDPAFLLGLSRRACGNDEAVFLS